MPRPKARTRLWASSLKLDRDIGVSRSTAWFMLHCIREGFTGTDAPMDGPVEVDETYIGGKRKNMSKAKRKDLHHPHRSCQHDGSCSFGGPMCCSGSLLPSCRYAETQRTSFAQLGYQQVHQFEKRRIIGFGDVKVVPQPGGADPFPITECTQPAAGRGVDCWSRCMTE